ncbi:MAG: DUF262 domain-containing protein [Sphaerochaetaceae bacterium]|nr:DUF262 domain-containing protein [Sphaerochaetaceae bacterium]
MANYNNNYKLIMSNNKELPMYPFLWLMGKTFLIPYQQRGYKWTTSNVGELLYDLWDFLNADEKKRVYCLQPLAVVPQENGNVFSVLDGQQRLTTLYLLRICLYGKPPYTFIYERDTSHNGMKRCDFMKSIDSIDIETAEKNIDFHFIYTAYHHIGNIFQNIAKKSGKTVEEIKSSFQKLLEGSKEERSLQVIWYTVKPDKQYETFRNLNSGKIELTNTDLIKALLLNRVSGLPQSERVEAAATFERMEQEMQNDHFWYMINAQELRYGQTRMDFLFNLVAGCKQSDYEIDPRWSFRNYFARPEKSCLSDKWKAVRHTFLRLKDMYDDIETYHYIGFLTYNSNDNPLSNMRKLLELNRRQKHSLFICELRNRIKSILSNSNHEHLSDYRYDTTSKKDLRLLFLMHNIETILQRYKQLHDNTQLHLAKDYERFPFELLHKQSWDIEHIASKTESDFKNPQDREDWLNSIKEDMGEDYAKVEKVKILEQRYTNSKKKDDFDELYKAVMRECDKLIGEDAIKDKDKASDGKDKMQVGNLTLLDSHTNRSYHNALFPRKRKYIIVAAGLSDGDDDQENAIPRLYIPPCTRQVFTKAYNKSNKLSLNAWTQTDADFYLKDMEQKLGFYFPNDKNDAQ